MVSLLFLGHNWLKKTRLGTCLKGKPTAFLKNQKETIKWILAAKGIHKKIFEVSWSIIPKQISNFCQKLNFKSP